MLIPRMGGFVYIVGPCGSLQQTLQWVWEFLPLTQPTQIFSAIGFEALFPHVGTLGCMDCLTPQLFLPVYPHANKGPPATTTPAQSSSHWLWYIVSHPLCPGCPSLPLLPVWMNISSLTLWLPDFHTIRFSGSSGCFLFLNLLLSFFCARRHSVSTYASILARSLDVFFGRNIYINLWLIFKSDFLLWVVWVHCFGYYIIVWILASYQIYDLLFCPIQ